MKEVKNEEYVKFMFDAKNSHNCKNCPEATCKPKMGWDGVTRCGQQFCWVDASVAQSKGQKFPY